MADFSLAFRALYGQDVPADPHDIVQVESMVREGVLSKDLGEVALITDAMTQDRPIEPGLANALVFMWVKQPRHVDYYCFHRTEENAKNSMPVILVADQTIVQTWPNFGAFLAWVSGQ
ncbi:MAG: hypothetical protein R3B94_09275 [Hyphomonas sp.]